MIPFGCAVKKANRTKTHAVNTLILSVNKQELQQTSNSKRKKRCVQMNPKLIASEFSSKVKAYNLIEENILKQRVDGYRRQRKNNLRMIEKDSKKMQEKLIQSSHKVSEHDDVDTLDYPTHLLDDSGYGDDNHHLKTLLRSHQQNETKRTKKKRRKKKSSHTQEAQNTDLRSSMVATQSNLLYQRNEQDMRRPTEKRLRSPGFLPRLNVTNSLEQLSTTNKPRTTKTNENLSLPPINGSSLTSSVSLPSLYKFKKFGDN